MPNMEYCRYENTFKDLQDCSYHLNDDPKSLSESEATNRRLLIELCKEIAENHEDEC